jgi:hypothetical protein
MERIKTIGSAAGEQVEEMAGYDVSRRRFFKLAGGIAGAGVLFAACHPPGSPTNLYLGSGDQALLNFLYVLEQIEAAFYTQAVSTPYYGISHLEYLALTDLRDQEITHREFLKALLGTNAVTTIAPDFSAVTFADRASVLKYAAIIEDIVISGINGSARLFTNMSYPFTFAKMTSVEARHSAYFRDLLTPNSFGDTVVDIQGLDQALSPSVVLANAEAFCHNRFDSSNLPN